MFQFVVFLFSKWSFNFEYFFFKRSKDFLNVLFFWTHEDQSKKD